MSQSEDSIAQAISRNHHDRLPVHLSGSIQPHGVLLALNTEFYIQQVSDNTEEYLGKQPQDLLNKSLNHLLDEQQVAAIKQCLVKRNS